MPSPEFRTRVESDVRFYLRQPSSPWITFDREGNAPVLQSGHTSILNTQGVFPQPARAIPPDAKTEASNMIVASDVVGVPDFRPRTARKALLVASIGIAFGAVIGLGVATTEGELPSFSTASAPPPAAVAPAAQPKADPPPPDLSSAGTSAPATVAPKKQGFGRLVLRGSATVQPVWLDGKLMLGSGSRQFMVACGDHTVAVGVKTNTSDVDIPCNGELVVAK